MSRQQKHNCKTEVVLFDFAGPEDEVQIRELLLKSGLPVEDIHQHLLHFIIARNEDDLIGCIGLEIHGKYGLLRSLAVAENYRGNGIAGILCKRLLENAQKRAVQNVYLLTTTAADFFRKKGFYVVDRKDAPDAIRATQEFSSICPSTSTLMKYHSL